MREGQQQETRAAAGDRSSRRQEQQAGWQTDLTVGSTAAHQDVHAEKQLLHQRTLSRVKGRVVEAHACLDALLELGILEVGGGLAVRA